MSEDLYLGFLLLAQWLRFSVDQSLLGALLGITNEQIDISVEHSEHLTSYVALVVELVQSRQAVHLSLAVHLHDLVKQGVVGLGTQLIKKMTCLPCLVCT